ncbi:isoprenoid synthase domain-containing protein [Mycena metata]|uniref:Isoprenoid synthase domain-containing protein n=1 Tax=Mycena metata TaxID=1033252 RepID=A0AAD7IIS1_9AGAR|nr:isoprenoid synthase domain-containing protein [Mycena metata]
MGSKITDTIATNGTDDYLKLKAIIRSLLDVVSYRAPTKEDDHTRTLEKAVALKVQSWNADDGQNGVYFSLLSKAAASMVEALYSRHPFEVKLAFALYVWFAFYIDDNPDRAVLEDYQRRVLLGLPQEESPVQHLHEVLGGLYQHWDPFCANAMSCAALEFITATVLEVRTEVSEMTVRPTATRWPGYLRAKSGMAPGFSCAAFPTSGHPDISSYIQVLPDMDDYICLVNDILSFYKEELVGENINYVHVRSKMTGKTPHRVLVEMVREVGDIHARIAATLAGHPEALASWEILEHGFIAWHFSIERYKLSQLHIC